MHMDGWFTTNKVIYIVIIVFRFYIITKNQYIECIAVSFHLLLKLLKLFIRERDPIPNKEKALQIKVIFRGKIINWNLSHDAPYLEITRYNVS